MTDFAAAIAAGIPTREVVRGAFGVLRKML